jgi:hypothetical protein
MSCSRKNFSKLTSRKTKKQSNQSNQSNQLGGGMFTTNIKTYSNLQYRDSSYKTDKLKCAQCSHDKFKHHTSTMSSRTRAFISDGDDFFGKKYNIFLCTKCGYMMNYSGKIKYNTEKE